MTATPGPVVVLDLWSLRADSTGLDLAGTGWRGLARQTTDTRTAIGGTSRTLLSRWRGEAAEGYRAHQGRVDGWLDSVAGAAERVAASLAEAAAVMRGAAARLEDALARARAGVPAERHGEFVVFHPTDAAGVARVGLAVAEAGRIRADLDARLVPIAEAVVRARDGLRRAAVAAGATLTDPTAGMVLPAEPAVARMVLIDGDRAIVGGTSGADRVRVGVDPVTGERLVTVNGVVARVPAGLDLVVRTGSGDDLVEVDRGTRLRVTLLGGEGDDTLVGGDRGDTLLGLWGDDRLFGGGGDDRVAGGDGRDYVDGGPGADDLDGGAGDDTLYGLAGTDVADGGAGQDYVDGGADGDRIVGGAGVDALLGGTGEDTLRGGPGFDRLYGGAGRDTVFGGADGGVAYVQAEDRVGDEARVVTVDLADVGGFITVAGSPEFVARVDSDLEALRSSPHGQEMLAALRAAHDANRSSLAGLPGVGAFFAPGHTLTIQETAADNGFAYASQSLAGSRATRVEFNPAFQSIASGPPITVLYHELAHVYDYLNGTVAEGTHQGPDNPGAPNAERVAVGLPIDHDGDPRTPQRLDPRHPVALTENALRDELGVVRRSKY
jgi:hypothetical protein